MLIGSTVGDEGKYAYKRVILTRALGEWDHFLYVTKITFAGWLFHYGA